MIKPTKKHIINLDNQELSINKEDTEENLKIKRQLLRERHSRIVVMSLLLAALLFTVFFGTLENPVEYTFSKIGNRFNHRILFIVWALFTGLTIQFSVVQLFRLERFSFSKAYKYIIASTFFLVATALAPSMRELYPFYFWVHKLTAVIFFVFLSLSMGPFLKFVSRENPRLRKVIIVWTIIILGGVIILGLLYGNTGLFELWGFGSMLIFLLYLSLTLFEEQIVKQSVKLLKGEQDLNLGIESIFVNWEKLLKKKKKKS